MKCVYKEKDGVWTCKNCQHTTKIEGLKHNCGKIPPTILRRSTNFTKAATKHLRTGMRHCTEEQRKTRFTQCSKNECGLFLQGKTGEEGICSHVNCGCYIRSRGRFLDKISWADSECPEGYWGPIPEKDDETPEKGV